MMLIIQLYTVAFEIVNIVYFNDATYYVLTSGFIIHLIA